MVSSIFDPLGFLAPFTVKAKCLLQVLCKQFIRRNNSLLLHHWRIACCSSEKITILDRNSPQLPLQSELQVRIDKTLFWTDSLTILRNIGNTSSRFYTFVANRLAVIHEGSQPDQWGYISTKLSISRYIYKGQAAKSMDNRT